MTKALFAEKRKEIVTFENADGTTTVQICLNGETVKQETEDGKKYTEYRYDFNEFTGDASSDFDLEAVKAEPAKYLDFAVLEKAPIVGLVPESTVRQLQSSMSNLESLVADMIGGAEE